jgi:nitroimidazol reductase NimA-like FMN-containing flavoprotein (pyridoxamine 5'-phosphate oxidase superfamily)
MTAFEPRADVDERYGEPGAATTWDEAVDLLRAAKVYWITTISAAGDPHVTPVIAVWQDGALHFSTGAREEKARNLRANSSVVLTTGTNALTGTDLVVRGKADALTDGARLQRLADEFASKYDDAWKFRVKDGQFVGQDGASDVYRVHPRTVYAFGKNPFSHTRWTF